MAIRVKGIRKLRIERPDGQVEFLEAHQNFWGNWTHVIELEQTGPITIIRQIDTQGRSVNALVVDDNDRQGKATIEIIS